MTDKTICEKCGEWIDLNGNHCCDDLLRIEAMTDEELIARLRMVTGFIRFETGDRIAASACLSEEAADRSEALTAKLAECEARLGKAVEALAESVREFDCPIARATLAEIKLQSSEFATQKGESHE